MNPERAVARRGGLLWVLLRTEPALAGDRQTPACLFKLMTLACQSQDGQGCGFYGLLRSAGTVQLRLQ